MKLKLPKPYISASQISVWHYNKGQYVDRYIFNVPIKETPELIFGKETSTYMEKGKWPKKLDGVLSRLIRYSRPEYELKMALKTPKGEVDLLGFIDSYSPPGMQKGVKRPRILEYKTGTKLWDKKRADEHFQTQLYAAIIYKQTSLIPEVRIQWVQTRRKNTVCIPTGVVRTFRVKITVTSMLEALQEAGKVAREIHDWYDDYLSGAQRAADDPMPPVPDWML